MLLLEYIEKSSKFCNYISSDKVSEDVLFSIIKQTLMGINIAQKYKKFSHYDLHSNNIMIKKCNKNLVFVYKLDEDNQFCVPTFGYYPIIIDFGFSYIENMNDKLDDIISQLDNMGIVYELSKNEFKPFNVIYKPLNKSDEFYKKFDDFMYLNNLESVVKTAKLKV